MDLIVRSRETYRLTKFAALKFKALVLSRSIRRAAPLCKTATFVEVVDLAFEREFGKMDAGQIVELNEKLSNELKAK